MNLLARSLHGTLDPQAIVQAAHHATRKIALPYVEAAGHRAFVGLIMGPCHRSVPRAREAVRKGALERLFQAVHVAWNRTFGGSGIRISGVPTLGGRYQAVFVRPEEGALHVAAVDARGLERDRAAGLGMADRRLGGGAGGEREPRRRSRAAGEEARCWRCSTASRYRWCRAPRSGRAEPQGLYRDACGESAMTRLFHVSDLHFGRRGSRRDRLVRRAGAGGAAGRGDRDRRSDDAGAGKEFSAAAQWLKSLGRPGDGRSGQSRLALVQPSGRGS